MRVVDMDTVKTSSDEMPNSGVYVLVHVQCTKVSNVSVRLAGVYASFSKANLAALRRSTNKNSEWTAVKDSHYKNPRHIWEASDIELFIIIYTELDKDMEYGN